MVNQIFLKYLNQFETTLYTFGYIKTKVEVFPSAIYKDNLSVEYEAVQIQRKININYFVSTNGKITLNLIMYKIPAQNTFFSLHRFLDNNNLKDRITVEISAGGDVEAFIKTFFEDLKSLFENELNDQITGKTFENHWDALRNSMNEY
jgi:hypothetical protein